MAKQRELSGTLDSEAEAKLKKQLSEAKCKELSGHNIFAPPPEIQPRPLAARALALRESITIGEATPNQVSPSFFNARHYIFTCTLSTDVYILRFTCYFCETVCPESSIPPPSVKRIGILDMSDDWLCGKKLRIHRY